MINKTIWAVLLISTLHLQAATEMNPEKVLSFTAASSGITRISVESDRIVETFVDPQDASNAIKNNRGHIYVSGQKQIPHMYLSLITKTNQVQDIKLTFKNIPAKPISLTTPQQKIVSTTETTSTEQYLKWLQVFLKGNAPQSFVAKPLSHLESSRQNETFLADPVAYWIHPEGYKVTSYRIRLYEENLKNPPDLKAEAFGQPGDLALVCSSRTFLKNKEVHLYVLRKETIQQTTPSPTTKENTHEVQ